MKCCGLCGARLNTLEICPECGKDYSEKKHNIFTRCISMFHISDLKENVAETVICCIVFCIMFFITIKVINNVSDRNDGYHALPNCINVTASDKIVEGNNIAYLFYIENTCEDSSVPYATLKFNIEDYESKVAIERFAPKSLYKVTISIVTNDLNNKLLTTPLESDSMKVGISLIGSNKYYDSSNKINKALIIIYFIVSSLGIVYGCGLKNKAVRIIVKTICSGALVALVAVVLIGLLMALGIAGGGIRDEEKRRKAETEAAVNKIKTASHHLSVAKQTMGLNADAKYHAATAEEELTSAYAELIGTLDRK